MQPAKSRIMRPLFDEESPNLTRISMPTYSTATQDMTTSATSGRHFSKFEKNDRKCRLLKLCVEFLWPGVLPAPPTGGLLVHYKARNIMTLQIHLISDNNFGASVSWVCDINNSTHARKFKDLILHLSRMTGRGQREFWKQFWCRWQQLWHHSVNDWKQIGKNDTSRLSFSVTVVIAILTNFLSILLPRHSWLFSDVCLLHVISNYWESCKGITWNSMCA